jgi:hypothetical protein
LLCSPFLLSTQSSVSSAWTMFSLSRCFSIYSKTGSNHFELLSKDYQLNSAYLYLYIHRQRIYLQRYLPASTL